MQSLIINLFIIIIYNNKNYIFYFYYVYYLFINKFIFKSIYIFNNY